MILAAFVEATEKRSQAFRGSYDVPEEEDDPSEPDGPIFSIREIIRESGPSDIADAIEFSWDEFQELFNIVERFIRQSGRGRKLSLEPIDRFFSSST
jgi:hypothetical protein